MNTKFFDNNIFTRLRTNMTEQNVPQICCQLKTGGGSICRQTRFRIDNDNPFNIYLCAQHLKCIAKDHIYNYYIHKINEIVDGQYLTISNMMRQRIITNSYDSITLFTNANTCLIPHNIIIDTTTLYRIEIPQYNLTFDILKRRRNERQRRNTLTISNELVQYINSIVLNEAISPIQLINLQRMNTNIPNRIIRTETNYNFKLIDITECTICSYSNESEEIGRKGFTLPCCNDIHSICIECIINQLITEHCKYEDITNITNTNFICKPIDCPFCRTKNCYKSLLKENIFKSTIKSILKSKLDLLYVNRVREQLILFE